MTCSCAIAVRAGDDVVVIDRCERRLQQEFGETATVRRLHTHKLVLGGSFTSGFEIVEYDSGKKYSVCMVVSNKTRRRF